MALMSMADGDRVHASKVALQLAKFKWTAARRNADRAVGMVNTAYREADIAFAVDYAATATDVLITARAELDAAHAAHDNLKNAMA